MELRAIGVLFDQWNGVTVVANSLRRPLLPFRSPNDQYKTCRHVSNGDGMVNHEDC
jgi:hypothetical protein